MEALEPVSRTSGGTTIVTIMASVPYDPVSLDAAGSLYVTVVMDTQGNLYGTTAQGGAYNHGVV